MLYDEAHLHGTARDQMREKLRRAVREILAFYFLAVLALFLYLGRPGVPEDHTAFGAILLGAMVGPGCWIAYRIIRFAVARQNALQPAKRAARR